MQTFFTSDFHIGHAAIIKYCNRPFKDVNEMNDEIVLRFNSIVKSEDVCFHLGDFAFNEKLVAPFLTRLNGTHHLISGNHDGCFSSHKKYKKSLEKYISYGFFSVKEKMELKIGNENVSICHLPFSEKDDNDVRYMQFRPINNGQFLLHGHCRQQPSPRW